METGYLVTLPRRSTAALYISPRKHAFLARTMSPLTIKERLKLIVSGDAEDQIRQLKRMILRYNQYATPHVLLAYAYEQMGDKEAAKEAWREAKQFAPTSSVIKAHLAYLEAGGELRGDDAEIELPDVEEMDESNRVIADEDWAGMQRVPNFHVSPPGPAEEHATPPDPIAGMLDGAEDVTGAHSKDFSMDALMHELRTHEVRIDLSHIESSIDPADTAVEQRDLNERADSMGVEETEAPLSEGADEVMTVAIAQLLVKRGAYQEAIAAFETLAEAQPNQRVQFEAQVAYLKRLVAQA